MNHLKHLIATAFLLALAACGGGAPPVPPPVTQTIGAAGGTVNGPSGATVVISAGALAKDTPIGIAQTDAGAPALPGGTTTFGAMFAFTPHGLIFAKPVTMTVPFDPGKVPVGTTPVLLKTNAAMNGWDVVAGATASGNMMTGQVTGFSLGTAGTKPPPEPTRHWDFIAYKKDGTPEAWGKGSQEIGDVFANCRYQDGQRCDTTPVVATTAATGDNQTGEVYSSANRVSYSALASGLVQAENPDDKIGNQVHLYQKRSFYKKSADSKISLLITKTYLHGILFGPKKAGSNQSKPASSLSDPGFFECKNEELDERKPPFVASVEFIVHGFRTVKPGNFEFTAIYRVQLIKTGSDGIVGGIWCILPMFKPSTLANPSSVLKVTADESEATVELQQPIPVPIPVPSAVPVNDETHNGGVTVEVDVYAKVYDGIKPNPDGGKQDSNLQAYFRDPVNQTGSTIEFTGFELTDDAQPPPPSPREAPECTTGPDPAAGSLQFSAPSFDQQEVPVTRHPVLVTRAGGSKGDVSVRVRSSDGAARAGQDYTAVDTALFFADGDTAPATVEVPVTLDTTPEPDKNLALTLSDARGCATLGAQKSATLNILDDDGFIETHTLGGTVSGLAGTGLALQDKLFLISQATPSGNGPFTLNFNYRPNTAYDVQVVAQPINQTCSVTNGKGTITTANITNVVVNCLTQGQNPALDPSFGSGGKVFVTFGATEAMLLQPDGKIVMAGGLFGLARVNASGSLDTGFGKGGTVTTEFPAPAGGPPANAVAHAVALQPDGKIVVVGEMVNGFVAGGKLFNSDFALARYNADGSLDSSFGTGGLVTTDFNGNLDRAYAVAIQPDGKIVVAGDATPSTNTDFGVARYNANGSLDGGFGAGGKVTTDLSSSTDFARDIALQSDGKIVVVGPIAQIGSGGLDDTGLVRYNADGSLDGSFGPGGSSGKVILPNTSASNAMLIQPDGKIVLGGNAFTGVSHGGNFLVMRLTTSGSLDRGFGNGGKATTDFSPSFLDSVSALVLQADGKIVAAGSRTFDSPAAGGGDFALARFNPNGTLDGSFDGDGKLTVDFFGSSDFATNVAVQSDGKIVVGGSVKNGSSGRMGLARVNP